MSETSHFRYRIEYAKNASMRFTSHLDVLRGWERTFRRAQLPLSFTQGFNPRPRINLSAALPLGFTSECELMDVWLTEELQAGELFNRIQAKLPPGLDVRDITQIDNQAPKLQKSIETAEYHVYLDPFPPEDTLAKRLEELLEMPKILRKRRGKSYDLRPLIHCLKIQSEEGQKILYMKLNAQEGATGRPDEILLQLNIKSTLIHRKNFSLTLSQDSR